MNRNQITRRSLLGASAAVCLPTLGLSKVNAAAQSIATYPADSKHTPKNILLLVSDGMSMGVPTLANPYSQLVRERETIWPKLLKNPLAHHGFLETGSLNSLVTDSAAAASAWGGGKKVNNGTLNILPDGTKSVPITVSLKEQGKRTGLVTTDKITGGTPSGFAVVQKSRHDYMEIAKQFIDRVDVMLGGGSQYFDKDSRPDKRDLLAEYEAKNYHRCSNRKEMLSLGSADRVLGLFANDVLPYTIDQVNDSTSSEDVPTLAEMTNTAIECLSDKDNGFFLMVEGARIDHAAHANDAAAILHDQIAFEDALETALEFVSNRDDTLLIVTSDHGNANPGLNGFGPGYSKTDQSFARLAKCTASFGEIRNKVRDTSSKMGIAEAAEEVIHQTCGLNLNREHARIVGEALVLKKIPNELAILQRSWVGVLSQVLGNHTGIGFTGTNHTADRTILTAIGPGSERFSGSCVHTDVHHHLFDLMCKSKA